MMDKIFDLPEIRKLKETFDALFPSDKMKRTIHHHHHKHYCCKCHQRLVSVNKQEDETKLSILLSFGKAFQDLQKIYFAIINSSKDLEKIFKTPMNYLTKERTLNFNFKFDKLHRDEFTVILHKDCCIKVFIIFLTLRMLCISLQMQ
jgi:hypothetical protein